MMKTGEEKRSRGEEDIEKEKIVRVIKELKNGKAIKIDRIPNKV